MVILGGLDGPGDKMLQVTRRCWPLRLDRLRLVFKLTKMGFGLAWHAASYEIGLSCLPCRGAICCHGMLSPGVYVGKVTCDTFCLFILVLWRKLDAAYAVEGTSRREQKSCCCAQSSERHGAKILETKNGELIEMQSENVTGKEQTQAQRDKLVAAFVEVSKSDAELNFYFNANLVR